MELHDYMQTLVVTGVGGGGRKQENVFKLKMYK